jgi:hypothetical protein
LTGGSIAPDRHGGVDRMAGDVELIKRRLGLVQV